MASPCEILTETDDEQCAQELLDIAAAEASRIESKFSRYIRGNIVDRINRSEGDPVAVDEETAHLLDFADRIFRLSDGAFDITSGVFRKAWKFDGGSHVPKSAEIDELLGLVGWTKVQWNALSLSLQPGMQIDFGGIGKEYAVDRAAQLCAAHSNASCLINFGGDLAVTCPRRDSEPWNVGIEATVGENRASKLILLHRGGLATSGNAKRYVLKKGIRYSHVLDARTGWPVADALKSVTVAADTCIEAGMLATMAMLHGQDAEPFLKESDVQYWCDR
jgi:thiamine biosynthesis lipoprotein